MAVFTKYFFELKQCCKCLFFHLKRDGLQSTFKHLPYLLKLRLTEITDKFDKTHGTDTANNVLIQDLDIDYIHKIHANMYTPTASILFKEIIESLNLNYKEYTFIDLGSGKGRVLLLASHYSFKKIIGIEFSKQLYIIAENNLKLYTSKIHTTNSFELYCENVTDYVFPNEDIVLYLFNPFDSHIISMIIANLHKTIINKHIIIIYYNPIFGDMFERNGFHLLQHKKNKNFNYGWHIYHRGDIQKLPY